MNPQNPYASCIVKASAGSGKTYQLSRRFIFSGCGCRTRVHSNHCTYQKAAANARAYPPGSQTSQPGTAQDDFEKYPRIPGLAQRSHPFFQKRQRNDLAKTQSYRSTIDIFSRMAPLFSSGKSRSTVSTDSTPLTSQPHTEKSHQTGLGKNPYISDYAYHQRSQTAEILSLPKSWRRMSPSLASIRSAFLLIYSSQDTKLNTIADAIDMLRKVAIVQTDEKKISHEAIRLHDLESPRSLRLLTKEIKFGSDNWGKKRVPGPNIANGRGSHSLLNGQKLQTSMILVWSCKRSSKSISKKRRLKTNSWIDFNDLSKSCFICLFEEGIG